MGVGDLTPAMRQYVALKEKYPDCILFFRMGDFYEMFFDDAVTAAPVLDIALTSRNKGKENAVPLCGVPWHAASGYIARLIENGFKVAVCEQMEDPRQAKGVVKRDVVRVVTPGLVLEPDNLQAKENNFLASVCVREGVYGLSFLDISTGDFRVTRFHDREFFVAEAAGLGFRELVAEEEARAEPWLKSLRQRSRALLVNFLPPDYFDGDAARERLGSYFPGESPDGRRLSEEPALTGAAGALLRYVEETQKERLGHLREIRFQEAGEHLVLDETARENLELFTTLREQKRAGSLFHALDETITSMGGRRLRWWLSYPLVNPGRISERLEAVDAIRERNLLRERLRKSLGGVQDLERLAARVSMGVANARDLAALRSSLEQVPAVLAAVEEWTAPLAASLKADVDEMADLRELIGRAIVDDPPFTVREGGIIREGYDADLDGLIALSRDGKRGIAALEETERRKTGISTLKVGYNSVFGYYIEVTKANADRVPPEYVRKQTLVNAERYINQELKEYEHSVLHAEDRRREREYELFAAVRDEAARQVRRIQATASALADLDALASLAEVAQRNGFSRPEVDDGDVIDIRDGRHPVVEKAVFPEAFVPNDTLLDGRENRFLIITGPNMAGKSTYIRQVALIVILAQMGGFVPAASARIGVADRIFTRIGAADNLARGQSTFMVEMNEVAGILRHGTPRSLVILDEVGRGTSTFDGLSIAWAVAEHLHDATHLKCRTLFATHYHQLTEMAAAKEGVKNYNIAVREWGDRIIFLRKIMEGGTNRSYGIQVARIAGVPEEVIQRAREILHNIENGEFDEGGMPRLARGKRVSRKESNQLSLFEGVRDDLLEEIRAADPLNMTPLEALQRIQEWKERLKKE
ncbi:MAG: DNA mismatch repair protein MutS [Syntrophales bacterium]